MNQFPPNRILREGESACVICGSGRRDHAFRDHAYNPDTWWHRLKTWLGVNP